MEKLEQHLAHNLPAHAVGVNSDILHLLAVEAIKGLSGALLEELDELGPGPDVERAVFRGHGQTLTGQGALDVVGEAHIAVEFDGTICKNGHSFAYSFKSAWQAIASWNGDGEAVALGRDKPLT